MKTKIIASALLVLSFNAHAFDQSVSAQAMADMCKNEDSESFQYATCMSNINGYMNGLIHAKVLDEMKSEEVVEPRDDSVLELQGACLPTDVNNAQLSQNFLTFMHQHNDQNSRDFFSAFYDSMKITYPCK